MHVEFQRFGGLSPALMNRAPRYVAVLTAEEAAHVRSLIPPDLYALTSSGPPLRGPDAFRYDIVVRDGENEKRLTLSEEDIPASLRPLVTWLGAQRA